MAKDRSKRILRDLEAFREEVLARLDRIEAQLAEDSPTRRPPDLRPSVPPAVAVAGAGPEETVAAPDAALQALPEGEIRVIVSPLRDLSLARAVESSLAQSEGIERATLRELRGDSATIDVSAGDGVSVIGSLRRHLPVAFDVTRSDEHSVTIALAQPPAGGEGGVAAPLGQ